MRQVLLILGAALWHCTVVLSSADAAMLPIFGPKQFTLTPTVPQVLTQSFTNCEPSALYKIVVLNGNPDGTQQSNAVAIQLNGTTIFGPKDVHPGVKRLEKPVTILATNSLTLLLPAQRNATITVSVECTANCLDVHITSPTDQSTVNRSRAIVIGTVTSSSDEVGVVVNNIAALVKGNQFASATIPLVVGSNTLSASATNACHNKATTQITVSTAAFQDSPIHLSVGPSSGLASLDASLQVDISLLSNPVSSFQWDFTGDGTIDSAGPNLSQLFHNYDVPGLFTPRVIVTDSQGNQFSDMAVISVFSLTEFNGLLGNRWNSLKIALQGSQVETAVSLFHPAFQDKYRQVFQSLRPNLPQIAAAIEDLSIVSLFGTVASLVTVRDQGGNLNAYLVYFMQDPSGLWKLVSM